MKSSLLWRASCPFVYLWLGIKSLGQGLPEPTIQWTGLEDVRWGNPANWSPARIPNATDHVVVEAPSGTAINLTGTQSIGSLRLGTEAGSGVTLNVQGTLVLASGGEVGGGGRVVQTGSLSGAALQVVGEYEWRTGRLFGVLRIASAGRLLLPDLVGRDLSSGNGGIPARIENEGQVRWLGGAIRSWDGSQILNRAAWQMEGTGPLFGYCCGGGRALFANEGTVSKAVATGDADFGDATLNSSGTLRVDAGALVVTGNANWTGTNRVAGTGCLKLVGGSHTWAGTVQSDGTLEIAGGNHGGALTISGPVPVVTVEPSFIDLLEFTGDEMQLDIAISNHGLIAAQDVTIGLDAHPDFTFTPLRTEFGTLPAQSSVVVTVPLAPVTITVFPDPRLVVQYFHQRDVFSDDPFTRDVIEPTVPINLAVTVANRGKGDARNVRIISSQPEVVENEKGLAIDFKIIATEVAGKSLTPGLTADFGLIAGGEIGIGRWLLTSTLQGLFLDFSATFEHLDSLGKTNLSLVEAVTIHEMNRLVEAGGAFSDGKPDFLVNDWPDADDMPDTLYLNDGRTNLVTLVASAEVNGTLAGANRQVQLAATVGEGWSYFRLRDPANGQFRLKRVTRSDGFEVSVQTNAWVTDRTFVGRGKRPTYENMLHLLDHDSTGRYIPEYEDLPSVDLAAPVSRVAALPASSYATIPLLWTGGDEPGGSGLVGFDVDVSVDDGPFAPWLQSTQVRGAVYRGEPGRRYAFYSVAVDKAGNREQAPLQPDAVTRVNLSNVAPTIAAVGPVTVDEGQVLTFPLAAVDADRPAQSLTFQLEGVVPAGMTVNPLTGVVRWVPGAAQGGRTYGVTARVTDNGSPPLSVP